jgi:hypothetical protein
MAQRIPLAARRLPLWLRRGAMALPLALPLAWTGPGSAAADQVLYTLNTRCSIDGAAPQACVVEAVDAGAATLYRHKVGTSTMTVRISDTPLRMERWNGAKKTWQPLEEAAARFSTNTICFNGRDLCVVNPNYLNSVRQDRPDATAGRDLVMVRFDNTGRVNLSCYDDGCKEVTS